MTGVRTRSARLVLLTACLLGGAAAGCGDARGEPVAERRRARVGARERAELDVGR